MISGNCWETVTIGLINQLSCLAVSQLLCPLIYVIVIFEFFLFYLFYFVFYHFLEKLHIAESETLKFVFYIFEYDTGQILTRIHFTHAGHENLCGHLKSGVLCYNISFFHQEHHAGRVPNVSKSAELFEPFNYVWKRVSIWEQLVP